MVTQDRARKGKTRQANERRRLTQTRQKKGRKQEGGGD
jgi:hypothetical protein